MGLSATRSTWSIQRPGGEAEAAVSVDAMRSRLQPAARSRGDQGRADPSWLLYTRSCIVARSSSGVVIPS